VRPEGLCQLKIPTTPGIDPATFRSASTTAPSRATEPSGAKCNVHFCVPQNLTKFHKNMQVDFTITRSRCNTNYTTNADHCTGILHNRYISFPLLNVVLLQSDLQAICCFLECHTTCQWTFAKIKVGHPRFTETRAIQYQPSVSVHNATFHSQCHTTHKGSNKTCYNNITLPTNIQYLKTHLPTKYDRRPHSDTQTELNIHELPKCNFAICKAQHKLNSTNPHNLYSTD
jgi:hypothetical protein